MNGLNNIFEEGSLPKKEASFFDKLKKKVETELSDTTTDASIVHKLQNIEDYLRIIANLEEQDVEQKIPFYETQSLTGTDSAQIITPLIEPPAKHYIQLEGMIITAYYFPAQVVFGPSGIAYSTVVNPLQPFTFDKTIKYNVDQPFDLQYRNFFNGLTCGIQILMFGSFVKVLQVNQ